MLGTLAEGSLFEDSFEKWTECLDTERVSTHVPRDLERRTAIDPAKIPIPTSASRVVRQGTSEN